MVGRIEKDDVVVVPEEARNRGDCALRAAVSPGLIALASLLMSASERRHEVGEEGTGVGGTGKEPGAGGN